MAHVCIRIYNLGTLKQSVYESASTAMNNIPTTSQHSLLNGMWFIFKDGNREIAAYSSSTSGRESVFINGELISDKKSLRLKSIHTFTFESIDYNLVIVVHGLCMDKVQCSLAKNDVRIALIRMYFSNNSFESNNFLLTLMFFLMILLGTHFIYPLLVPFLIAYFFFYVILLRKTVVESIVYESEM